MTTERRKAPRLSLDETAVDDPNTIKERAQRLALLFGVIVENPVTFKDVIGKYKTVQGVIDAADHPDVQSYGKRPDSVAEHPYKNRALHRLGQVLRFGDDTVADTDGETTSAFLNSSGNHQTERRILRIKTLAGEVALAQSQGLLMAVGTPDFAEEAYETGIEHREVSGSQVA